MRDALLAAGIRDVVVGEDGRLLNTAAASAAGGTTPIHLSADTLARTTGPDSATMRAVREMLAASVERQHARWATTARARVANVWREARGGNRREGGAGLSSPRELYGGGQGGPSGRGPVEVYHGLRDPRRVRAHVDADPLVARPVAPPGGNLDLATPAAGRPRLLRPPAAEVFVREPPPPPGPSLAVAAHVAAREAARGLRAEAAAETSRRYFGTATFRRPGTISRRAGSDGGVSTATGGSAASTGIANLAEVGGPGRLGAIPEWGAPARRLDAALRAPPVARSTAPSDGTERWRSAAPSVAPSAAGSDAGLGAA